MDDYELFKIREKARRNRRSLGKSEDLWDRETWATDPTEQHHVGKRVYDDYTTPVPISMHRELSRRQSQEHPKEGGDPTNPLECLGRFLIGLADLLEGAAEYLREFGRRLIAAAARGERRLAESLRSWVNQVSEMIPHLGSTLSAAVVRIEMIAE